MIKNIERIKRLFLPKKEKSFSFVIQELTGFKPNDPDIYDLAFIHKSTSIKQKNGRHANNERLEFLGDAILDAIVADIIYVNYPNRNEGFLTSARAKLVSRNTLNSLAEDLGLEKLVKTTSNNPNTNIPGNTLEALIGAIYLDQGYNNCKNFVETRLYKKLDEMKNMVRKDSNYKSLLLEWSQKNRKEITFSLVKEVINKHNVPTFYTQVLINDELYADGTGTSKKESHQDAAKKAIQALKEKNLY
ncbi:ribonuclease III [Saccharicrinis sp. FJH62]|uniref:ribonuclease III n=1 Tax=Saccharicrinis sp. FJH62 TaxID=3344657 RepID=UPI0035D4C6D9